MMRLILMFLVVLFSIECSAVEAENKLTCSVDLKNLVLPSFKADKSKNNISAELMDSENGVYRVNMFSDPETADERMVGEVLINSTTNVVYDSTSGGDHPVKLNLDVGKVKSFVNKCLKNEVTDAFVISNLPIRLTESDGSGGYSDCFGHSNAMNRCGRRYHEYKINAVAPYIRNQLDSKIENVLELPSISKLRIFLASSSKDSYVYFLYVFDDQKLISKEVVGRIGEKATLAFDISKDYLITTYLRETDDDEEPKLKKVIHQKLDSNGKFITCQKSNPTCK
jgi:hypothetical protein